MHGLSPSHWNLKTNKLTSYLVGFPFAGLRLPALLALLQLPSDRLEKVDVS